MSLAWMSRVWASERPRRSTHRLLLLALADNANDILAWDVFFPLSMLFAAPAFGGSRLARWIRRLMIASGVLAFAGLSGVVTGDMQLRNVGIAGYVGVFLAVAVLLAVLFYRSAPRSD